MTIYIGYLQKIQIEKKRKKKRSSKIALKAADFLEEGCTKTNKYLGILKYRGMLNKKFVQ